MRTAIYIEDGVRQIVFTPENDYEKKILQEFEEGTHNIQVYFGSFFECRGGWIRHTRQYYGPSMFGESKSMDTNDSLIMVVRDAPTTESQQEKQA